MPKNIKIRKDEPRNDDSTGEAGTTGVGAGPQKTADELEVEAKVAEEAAIATAAQDEFQVKGFELVEWVQDNRSLVLGSIAAVLIGCIALGGWFAWSKSSAQAASSAFATAYKNYEAPISDTATVGQLSFKTAKERATASAAAFQRVVDDAPRTGAGRLAMLYAGHSQRAGESWDAAVGSYRRFLDSTASDDPLRFAAYLGLSSSEEGKGNVPGAIAALEEFIATNTLIGRDQALLDLGRLYKKSGDKAKAKASLQRIIDAVPESPLKEEAMKMLAAIDAPPAPPPPPKPADTDNDSIPDNVDNCPKEAGTAENNGCAAKQLVAISGDRIDIKDTVYFKTGSAVIDARSFGLLDNIATVLTSHDEVKMLTIEGHTDNAGVAAKNLALSQGRAASVKTYLEKKGVAATRLASNGFGDQKPLADNATLDGRAKNRRVEFRIAR
jgi:outer membrane protein OmpA-like peptidoglycan-associated protein/predicted negative regulator of RcsB-dependent stress response